MGYTAQRDRILVHAKAAALAANSKWTDVAIAMPNLSGSKGVRVFYGGEGDAPRMPGKGSLRGEFIGEHVSLVAWWSVSGLTEDGLKLVDDEMYAFKHQLRTRVQADQTLSAASVGVDMSYAEPDVVVVGGTRYALLGVDFTVAYTEYLY